MKISSTFIVWNCMGSEFAMPQTVVIFPVFGPGNGSPSDTIVVVVVLFLGVVIIRFSKY